MITKRKINKISKEWCKYYKKNINSKEFKEFEEKLNKSLAVNNNAQATTRVGSSISSEDIFEAAQITICDVLNNEGLAKLIKQIKSLSKKEFSYECNYVSASRPKFDYVRLQYMSTGYGILADIKFLNDKYIESVQILKSQINNYHILVEYIFTFRKAMDADLCKQFIYDNILSLSKKDYCSSYVIDKKDNLRNFYCLIQSQRELFSIICQHYITTYLYSEEGRDDKLPSMTFCTKKNHFNLSDFNLGLFGNSYYNKKLNYVIQENLDNDEFILFAGNNSIPRFCVSELICRFGNSFYYLFLGQRFLNNFEYDFSKYATGRKSIGNYKLSKLLDYYYGLVDNQFHSVDIVQEFKNNWVNYQGNEIKEFNPNIEENLNMYKDIFYNAYEHFKAKKDLSVNKTGRIISYSALAISVISVITSIILHFL